MGNDGGSIPRRNELVKEKKKDPKADERVQTIARWFYCALSKSPLRTPIVADFLGTLYNREAILELLLDRSKYGDADVICAHIRSLKDVITLNLTPNPEFRLDEQNGTGDQKHSTVHAKEKQVTVMGGDETVVKAQFICPITRREMNGQHRFVFSRRCGCVVSEQAIKKIEERQCLVCNKPVSDEDYIPINPKKEELEKLKANFEAFKKERKNKRKKDKAQSEESGSTDEHERKAKQARTTSAPAKPTQGATNKMSSKIHAILEKHRATSAQRPVPEAVRSLYTSAKKERGEPELKTNPLFSGTFTRYAA